MKTLEQYIHEITLVAEDYEARAKAWGLVRRRYKANGGQYTNLADNFRYDVEGQEWRLKFNVKGPFNRVSIYYPCNPNNTSAVDEDWVVVDETTTASDLEAKVNAEVERYMRWAANRRKELATLPKAYHAAMSKLHNYAAFARKWRESIGHTTYSMLCEMLGEYHPDIE